LNPVKWDLVALVGVAAALSVGATACHSASKSNSSSTTPTTTGSGSSVLPTAKRGVVTIRMTTVGDPGNPSVGVLQTFGLGGGENWVQPPKGPGIYKSCSAAPASPKRCLTVGSVKYTYGIGEYETTVSQYVTFLNTVDPNGKNPHRLYIDNMSPTVWPQYGPIRYSPSASAGEHYSVAYPEWADKPFNFGDFRRGARFANSLTNGTVLSKTQESSGAFKYVTYKVRLSPRTEQGMYDMKQETPTRTETTGFVLPSNDEWIKAAYFDRKGGGTDSYWEYPTGPFDPPHPSKLDPGTGDVVNAGTQPLSTYNPNDPVGNLNTPGSPPGPAPNWCPSQAGSSCGKVFPPDLPTGNPDFQSAYMANVSTVGQTKTPSPWGTYDMGGNVVEVLDSLAPQPPGYHFFRDWRYYHGGIANAPAYQLGISAFGYNPGDSLPQSLYPWVGFRLGVVGEVK
jgi:formylglycine-generating enzyme required for sulfatase activity